MISIDLNADLGEGGSFDNELLNLVSSASIACGGHAGSDAIMRETLMAARAAGVRTGAHPGFVDPDNFGRVELNLPLPVIAHQVIEQIARIVQIAQGLDQPIAYFKLHGALYNMAARDEPMATHLFRAVQIEFGDLPVLALDNSAQIFAAARIGLPVIREGFADRAYTSDGKLMPRSKSGSVLEEPDRVVTQVVRMAREHEIVADDGTVIVADVQSICLHGDNAAAVQLAKAIRTGLDAASIAVGAQT